MATIRSFIALPLASELVSVVSSIQHQLIESGAEVKWDKSDKFHITLKFLGDIDSSRVPQITDALKKSIGNFQAFDLTYVTLGGFPNVDHPRVVWIGTNKNQQILDLQRLVDQVCTSFGFAKDDRSFHAHITLGRLKGSRNLDRLTASLKSITFDSLLSRCSEVHFMRSELKPTGSVYTLLNSIPLAS